MTQFIIGIILSLIGIIAVGYGIFAASPGKRGGPVAGGVFLLVLAFGLYAWGGVKSVPIKNIGIPVVAGAIGNQVYFPGAHETWQPWMHLTDIDETVQTTTWEDSGNDKGSSCNGGLRVRIGGQQTGCADITLQWQIAPGAAAGLLNDYASSGNFMNEIKNAVVVRELESVVNFDVGDYNPITDVSSVTGTTSQTSQFSGFGPAILAAMRKDIGTRVKVLTVLFPQINYPTATEDKLAGIQQTYADYATAVENVKVAHEQNLALTQLGDPSLNQLAAKCLALAGATNPGSCIPGASTKLAITSSK